MLFALPLYSNNQRILAASPDYIRHYGEPLHPSELTKHQSLIFMMNGHPFNKWLLYQKNTCHTVHITSQLISDASDSCRRWAIEGLGIVFKSRLDLSADLAAGCLKQILPSWQGADLPLNFLCPHREQLTALVRHFYQFLRQHLAEAELAQSNVPSAKPIKDANS